MIICCPVIICDYCQRLIARKDDEENWIAVEDYIKHFCSWTCEAASNAAFLARTEKEWKP